MMDLLVCGAPLDNSFQKDRLELVNKGSLGRRRKPSRSNLKLLLSPSNETSHVSTSFLEITNKESSVNGDICVKKSLQPSQSPDNFNQKFAVNGDVCIRKPPQASTQPPVNFSQKFAVNGDVCKQEAPQASTPSPVIFAQKFAVNGDVCKRRPPSASTLSPEVITQKFAVNGDVCKQRYSPQNFKPPIRIESSLPRTWSEPNHVNDAHQFTIEAKLKRKKSDVGRSAVLIQTWERRTRSNSFNRQQQLARNSTTNRFQNKENLLQNTMPDTHVRPMNTGSVPKVEPLKNGSLGSNVRDAYSDEHYGMPENGPSCTKSVQMNGKKQTKSDQEPEWISLSRKLRAKYVAGNRRDI